MKIGFNHVAIRVRDMDASVRFLQGVLGDGAETIDLTAGVEAPRVVLVGTEDGVFFDLFSEGGAAPKDGPPYGLIHYALGVTDVDAAYAAALAAGATELMPPTGDHIRHAYVYDPNGDVCELVDDDWIEKVRSKGDA